MNQTQLIKISTAKYLIEMITDTNGEFLKNVASSAPPADVPATIEALEGGFKIQFFGHEAESIGRIVQVEDEVFEMEYVFYVQTDDDHIEVARIYLTRAGRVFKTLPVEPRPYICDFNDMHCARNICGSVIMDALKSPLFSPTSKA